MNRYNCGIDGYHSFLSLIRILLQVLSYENYKLENEIGNINKIKVKLNQTKVVVVLYLIKSKIK